MKKNKKIRDEIFKLSILYRILIVGIIIGVVIYFVYLTNGTQKGYLQLIYIPIILAAYFWGKIGGIAVATISGFLLGPIMPLDISKGIMQETSNWVLRLAILIIIGFLIGTLFDKINKLNNEAKKKAHTNPFTGAYNINKLLVDLEDRMTSEANFKVIIFKLTNIEGIEKYVNYKLVKRIVTNLIEELEHVYESDKVYSNGTDEIILISCFDCLEHKNKVHNIIQRYGAPVTIDNYKFRLALKAGIYEYQGEVENPEEIYRKTRIAYEQGGEKESGVYYFDPQLETSRKKTYEITGFLIDAIEKEEFYLVYQPKININDNTIAGVEALIRWDRGEKEFIGPNIFIRIAEEIGYMREITRYVLNTATSQLADWQDKDINLMCGINVTANELLDDNFIEWLKNLVDKKRIDRSIIEIEVTERIVSHENIKLINQFHELQKKGYKISIDDFGTGYNSLMSIGEIPFDLLKVDKYFIDRLDKFEIKVLVENIINYAHKLDKIVIAEGVETEKQLDILKEIKCDRVQGYYYSKPLLPAEFEKFYYEFKNQP